MAADEDAAAQEYMPQKKKQEPTENEKRFLFNFNVQ